MWYRRLLSYKFFKKFKRPYYPSTDILIKLHLAWYCILSMHTPYASLPSHDSNKISSTWCRNALVMILGAITSLILHEVYWALPSINFHCVILTLIMWNTWDFTDNIDGLHRKPYLSSREPTTQNNTNTLPISIDGITLSPTHKVENKSNTSYNDRYVEVIWLQP